MSDIPHQAIIQVTADVMARLPSGQVSGQPLKTLNGIYTVFGNSVEECTVNVDKWLEAARYLNIGDDKDE